MTACSSTGWAPTSGAPNVIAASRRRLPIAVPSVPWTGIDPAENTIHQDGGHTQSNRQALAVRPLFLQHALLMVDVSSWSDVEAICPPDTQPAVQRRSRLTVAHPSVPQLSVPLGPAPDLLLPPPTWAPVLLSAASTNSVRQPMARR